jgi:hypothetical protein
MSITSPEKAENVVLNRLGRALRKGKQSFSRPTPFISFSCVRKGIVKNIKPGTIRLFSGDFRCAGGKFEWLAIGTGRGEIPFGLQKREITGTKAGESFNLHTAF